MNNVLTIARFTFYEAVRSRLFIMIMVGIICLFGLTVFVGELAITESRETQVILIASLLRIFAVCTIGLFVITSMVREFNDKGFELILSLPLPRTTYYFGKYAGFVLFALIIAIISALILLLYGQVVPVFAWFFSLLCESLIVIAMSLLCMFTFSNITIAYIVVIAFYLLSRSMYAIQLISTSPILEFHTFSQEFMNNLVAAIAFVLPELNIYTRSEWLAYGVNIDDILPILLQTIIYIAVLSAAGLFDLYRKDL